jgi:ubiquitin-like-conjugating enzyme ATG10
MEFKHYPYLDSEEFSETCHFLDRHYRQATLGPLRRRWKLRVNTALATAFGNGEPSTYVQIVRELEAGAEHEDLSCAMEKFTLSDGAADCEDMDLLRSEEEDEVRPPFIRNILVSQIQSNSLFFQAVVRKDASPNAGHVVYEIHLHPTYRVPCLWFSLHDLPPGEAAFDIDTVFRRLVPGHYKEALRDTSRIGGISGDVCFHAAIRRQIGNFLEKKCASRGI